MVMERVQEEEEEDDTAEASTTQCTHNHHDHHSHKPTTDSGICPFCLQEKLTKLVSSTSSSYASPFPVFPSCPSPTSPTANSSRSEPTPAQPTLSSLNITHHLNATTSCHNEYSSTRSFLRIPFVQTQKKKKSKNKDQEQDSISSSSTISLSRSKSTTTPRSRRDFDENTPRKRGFFRSLVSLSRNPSARKVESRDWREEVEESTPRKEGSLEMAAFDGKVSRSRSVSCGGGGGGGSSRGFSGDIFDRISTGFGDCALRRAESYRESKQKITAASHSRRGSAAAIDGGGRGFLNESVKCGGIFGGFMPNSSSSSSSSSSCLVSSSFEDGKAAAVVRHGRSKSWGWAFASPLRALNYMHPPSGRREGSNRKKNNPSPNIHAIPSILVFRG